jgi:hypothetical protein
MFRFTIRDVLWLTALVAMGAGWWLDHRQISPNDRQLLQYVKWLGMTAPEPGISNPIPGTTPTIVK